jgi:two-component system nitrogen regulation sensor histidine kinase NtrY
LPNTSLQRAADGEVIVFTNDNEDRVRALGRLDGIAGTFLYVGRFVDSDVLNHMKQLRRAVDDYRQLETKSSGIQITFTMIYLIVALLLLLAAIWVGLTFANRLVRPIATLVAAAERVRSGDLTARVPEGREGDEIASLSRAFNRMTGQLEGQRAELIEANRQLDDRRRFTEAVLFGVSAGVLGLDPEGRIFLPNRSALDLLSCPIDNLVGRPLEQAVPEMAPLMAAMRASAKPMVQDQLSIVRDDRARRLLVRITVERGAGQLTGYVVTFDDITELVTAQRTAAWADVARRIAHEIKNPLTPIQLAAERLKKKYLDAVTTDPEVFATCIDTIVRQVADIRRMVDEFSAFARMPAPVRVQEDLVAVVERALSLQKIARAEIEFTTAFPDRPVDIHCDARQVGQAVTNLLQNAVDAIQGGGARTGRIVLGIEEMPGKRWAVTVVDNGPGLPTDQRDRLTEPYVTTRAKGTGLGLAIVKKIMEDHGGELKLEDGPGGARVSLIFPGETSVVSETAPEIAHSVKQRASHGS